MFNKLNPWTAEPAPSRPEPNPEALARRRVELWVEFKRLHLGFAQALNSLTYGHSNALSLIRHAMLAEFEARKLTGEEPAGSKTLIAGEAMRQAIARCRTAYARVTSRAFDDKALSGMAEEADPHLIQLMLSLTTAPFDTADAAMKAVAVKHGVEDLERAARFSVEIRKLHSHLRHHFTDLAKRAGLA